jgi:hypothetical protein
MRKVLLAQAVGMSCGLDVVHPETRETLLGAGVQVGVSHVAMLAALGVDHVVVMDKMDVETHVVDGGKIVSGYTSADGMCVTAIEGIPTARGWRTFLGENREMWPIKVPAATYLALTALGMPAQSVGV